MSKELLIISDTAIYGEKDSFSVFEPTLVEIEELTKIFDKIYWYGFYYGNKSSASARKDSTGKIILKCFPKARGGDNFFKKLYVLLFLPIIIMQILSNFYKFKYVHSRGPSVPALIMIFISFFDNKRKYWHKYAGDWKNKSMPFFYKLQKLLLTKLKKHKVTINGFWPDQLPHCISFENPCINEKQLMKNCYKKNFSENYIFCFVGSLQHFKGAHLFLNAINNCKNLKNSHKIYIVGDGPEKDNLKDISKNIRHNVIFTGHLDKNKINDIYNESHFIVLPSKTEGFPKVIAEAANYGCIPISSNISSIPHYIEHDFSGFLWDLENESFNDFFDKINFDKINFESMSENIRLIAPKFTYSRFLYMIKEKVFCNEK